MKKTLLTLLFAAIALLGHKSLAQTIPGSGRSAAGFNPAYIEIPNFPRHQFPFTIMSWVKVSQVPTGNISYPIFSSSQGATGQGYRGFWLQITPAAGNTSTLLVSIGNAGCFSPACRRSFRAPIPNHLINTWMHVAAVMTSPSQAQLYINGISITPVEDGNTSINSIEYPPASQINNARIGSYNYLYNALFNGEIDELSVWSIALTAAQVRQYMCSKIPASTTGLLAYYKFDEPNATVAVEDASTPAYNGSTTGGTMSRPLSGAYIGDESGYTYNPGGGLSWTNSFSESFDVVNPSTNVQGVHVYTVEDNPNHFNGIGADSVCTLGRYHGVFFATNSAANATASLSINGSGPYGGAYRRDANDDTPWNGVTVGLSLGDTMSFPLTNSQEFITVSGGQYDSGLPDTIVHCNFPLTIQANDYPGGTITWQHGGTGSTTQVLGPGWYFLEATSNCASLSFSDSVFVMDDTIVVDTLVFLCPGQSFSIGGQTFQDVGSYSFLNANPQGCDTLYQVVIEPSTEDIIIDTLAQICQGESFVIGGNTFTLDGQYQFTITSPNGCDSVINLTVEVLIDSVLAIEPFDEVICIGQETTLRVFPMNSGLLSWSNGQTGETTTIRQGGYYAVTFQGQCGVQEDSIFVEDRDCKPRIYIPTAFTPNGDGVNDRFEVKGDGIRQYSIRIFSRWGAEVFYSTSLARTWDGTVNGEPALTGVYVYVVTVLGFDITEVLTETGSLTLMR